MIHRAEQHVEIAQRLSQVVVLQLAFLDYAAAQESLTEAGCASHLEGLPGYEGRGEALAAWLWRGDRIEPLREFAKGPADAKQEWVAQVRSDVGKLFAGADAEVALGPEEPAEWMTGGSEFLAAFWETFASRGGLAAELFSPSESSTSRADWLAAYRSLNARLCSACDENDAIGGTADADWGEIDHFLPKSLYPQFAVHPWNLLPVCHDCNAFAKGSSDPLEGPDGKRRLLNEPRLPYRGTALTTCTRVTFTLTGGSLTVDKLVPEPEDEGVRTALEVLEHLYKVEARWRGKSESIGESVFRRIRDACATTRLTAGPEGAEADWRDPLRAKEHTHALARLAKRDLGEERYSFTIFWWLEALTEWAPDDPERFAQSPLGLLVEEGLAVTAQS